MQPGRPYDDSLHDVGTTGRPHSHFGSSTGLDVDGEPIVRPRVSSRTVVRLVWNSPSTWGVGGGYSEDRGSPVEDEVVGGGDGEEDVGVCLPVVDRVGVSDSGISQSSLDVPSSHERGQSPDHVSDFWTY